MRKLLYTSVSVVSFIVRNCYLPNPFETLKLPTVQPGIDAMIPIVLNLICEPLIAKATFTIVGTMYVKKSNGFVGSVLYLLFYIIHLLMLYLMIHLGFFTSQWNVLLSFKLILVITSYCIVYSVIRKIVYSFGF